MTANLRAVKALAKKLGAKVEYIRIGDAVDLCVEAPPGFVWKCDGDIHELVDASRLPWGPDYEDVLARMSHGVEKCEEPDCDWRRDNGLRP